MSTESARHVVIVGGGFSGTCTALNLARSKASDHIRVTVIDPAEEVGPGLAYRFDDHNLLLNVPAGNMSAFADDPDDFLNFCRSIDPSFNSGSFVPRRLYGQYLRSHWARAEAARPDWLQKRVGTVLSLSRTACGAGWLLTLATGDRIAADQVVLALGHQAPGAPRALGTLNQRSAVELIGAWDFEAMHQLPSDQAVLILGTGHTAVDTLFCLVGSTRRAPVYLLSRRGLLPREHRKLPTAPTPQGFPSYLAGVKPTVRAYLSAFRGRLTDRAAQGGNWRDAMNELRPYSPQIWQSLEVAERRRFLRHLQPYWDVHRHRLAPIAARRLHDLQADGRVQILAGRLVSVSQGACGVVVSYAERGSQRITELSVGGVINCTGPSTDIQRYANPLLGRLLTEGWICPDVNNLGLSVTHDLQVINAGGQPVDGLWYVGPLLKGMFWEATAVPELRVHAQRLADCLIKQRRS